MVIEQNIEKSEEGLELIIGAALMFEENHYLEAVSRKKMDDYDILQLTEDVRLWHSRMRKESLKLAAFSEHFLEEFATDNNLRFHEAMDLFSKVRSTISGSRKMFKKFCMRMMKNPTNPQSSNSLLDRSLLSANIVSRDIFGIQSYNDKVCTLYEEMKMFFTTLVMTLALCHRMIRDEKRIMQDAPRCLEIYRKCRESILSSARLFAKTFNVDVRKISENELIERRKNAKSLQDWAQKYYHRMNKAEQLTVVAYEVASEGSQHGMTATEEILWPGNVQKVEHVREVISHFNELVAAGKKNIDGYLLLTFIKWCGVNIQHEHKLYDYFCENYQGGKHVVGWTQVFNKRKELKDSVTDQQLADTFEKDVIKLCKAAA